MRGKGQKDLDVVVDIEVMTEETEEGTNVF